MTTIEWGTIREAVTRVLSQCLKQLKRDTLPEKSLQDKYPAPGPREIDAHQCKENCRAETPPEQEVVSQPLGLCPSGMRCSLAQTTSLFCYLTSFPTILLQWKVVTDFVVI